MKKLTLILLAFVLVASACKKEEEEEENKLDPTSQMRGFAINYTATWCGPCGNWGAPRIHQYAHDAPHGAVITAHASGDPMHVAHLYSSFSSARETGGGIPSFWVADSKGTSDGDMKSYIAAHGTAKAGVDMSFEKEGNKMTVKTMTKFFSPTPGEYYLSVLILENGIDGSTSAGAYKQSGVANPDTYKHDYVLRASSIDLSAHGEMIASSPSDGKTIEKTYTFTIDPSWKKVYPVAIIWRKEAGSKPEYKFVNSYKI